MSVLRHSFTSSLAPIRIKYFYLANDFINKHIFPGGLCPSFSALTTAMAQNSTFTVELMDNIGTHYATVSLPSTPISIWYQSKSSRLDSARVAEEVLAEH